VLVSTVLWENTVKWLALSTLLLAACAVDARVPGATGTDPADADPTPDAGTDPAPDSGPDPLPVPESAAITLPAPGNAISWTASAAGKATIAVSIPSLHVLEMYTHDGAGWSLTASPLPPGEASDLVNLNLGDSSGVAVLARAGSKHYASVLAPGPAGFDSMDSGTPVHYQGEQRGIGAGDLNGDGIDDLVIAEGTHPRLFMGLEQTIGSGGGEMLLEPIDLEPNLRSNDAAVVELLDGSKGILSVGSHRARAGLWSNILGEDGMGYSFALLPERGTQLFESSCPEWLAVTRLRDTGSLVAITTTMIVQGLNHIPRSVAVASGKNVFAVAHGNTQNEITVYDSCGGEIANLKLESPITAFAIAEAQDGLHIAALVAGGLAITVDTVEP
jgi:hypothetical protein